MRQILDQQKAGSAGTSILVYREGKACSGPQGQILLFSLILPNLKEHLVFKFTIYSLLLRQSCPYHQQRRLRSGEVTIKILEILMRNCIGCCDSTCFLQGWKSLPAPRSTASKKFSAVTPIQITLHAKDNAMPRSWPLTRASCTQNP